MDQHPVPEKIRPANAGAGVEPKPFTLILQLDAWNIRERDYWGQTQKRRRKQLDCGRWHWVYTGTCFRLDQRLNKNGRAMILSRGFAATRQGLDAFRQQLWAEATRHGRPQAEKVLVVADGALWIWNLVEDRFQEADQRLDWFHASQHLWEVAAALHGKDTPEASLWIEPLLRQLKKGQGDKVIRTLDELAESLKRKKETRKIVQREAEYFRTNRDRLDYARGQKLGEPIGSGAVEATCRQYQCRFKRPGQFWTQVGDEALLSLETFWRNGRWSVLYPHSQRAELINN
jgi:hypothetical protein